jgi:hypothetical protein
MVRVSLLAAVLLAAQLRADELRDAMMLLAGGDARAGIAALQRLGEKGNLRAQIWLGGIYQHPVPAIKDAVPEADYPESMKWFLRASAQGSGQASAEVGEMYESGLGVAKSAEKAAEWFDLAAKQGWDQQELAVACFVRAPGEQRLVCESQGSLLSCPTGAEMDVLRAAGVTGVLQPGGGGIRSRGGPKARALVILDHPIGGPETLKQPRHASVIYVQGKTGWQTIPPNISLLDRPINLEPQANALQSIMAFVQDVDGSLSGYACAVWPKR